jgi:hypothetical protein
MKHRDPNDKTKWVTVSGGGAGDGGHYIPEVEQQEAGKVTFSFVPSREDMPQVQPVTVDLPEGEAGKDYVLTGADKAEIAEMVDGVTLVAAPVYVQSVADMTDTGKIYVLASTGHIYAYMDTTTEQEVTVTDQIVGTTDNPYEIGRLSSSGTVSADVNTHVVSPYIDLTKEAYQGKTVQIHLEGNRYASEATETYIMCGTYDTGKTAVNARAYTSLSGGVTAEFDNAGMQLEILGETSAVMTIPVPLVNDASKTVSYMRFCGLGTEAASNIYITYTETKTVTGSQWVDTGTTYAPTLTAAERREIAEAAAALIDTQMLDIIGDGVVTA